MEQYVKKVKKTFGFWKTTFIGGVIFLLPLIVIGALVGQVAPIVFAVAKQLGGWIPVHTPRGIALLTLLALGIVVAICFLAGMAARRSFARRISETVEKNLIMLFPRYLIVKEQMTGSIGGDDNKPQLKPVVAQLDDLRRIAFEVERAGDGAGDGTVAVYLPGSPDPWSGVVVYLTADRVRPLEIDFSDALATFEQLGRDSAHLLADGGAPAAD